MFSGPMVLRRFVCRLLLMLLTLVPVVGQAETLVLGSDKWCPYVCTPGSSRPGYMVELARAVFEPQGIHVEYQNIPWPRAKVMLHKGTLQGLIAATPANTADLKPAPVFPTEDEGRMHIGFYTLATSGWFFRQAPSLTDIRLGVVEGYDYGPHIQPYISRWKDSGKVLAITGKEPITRLIKLMRMGRIDAVLEDDDVFHYAARRADFDNYRLAGSASTPASMNRLYIAFSPADPHAEKYARLLSEGVTRLRQSGELARILQRYGLRDWQ